MFTFVPRMRIYIHIYRERVKDRETEREGDGAKERNGLGFW